MASRDSEEFIAILNDHGVRYLLIGAHAVAFHARSRATKDLDVLLDPTPRNACRALAAIRDFFGGADLGYTVADLMDPGWIIQLGVAPRCTRFQAAWKNRVQARFGSVKAHYLGLTDLIRAKEAAGTPQDQADVHVLRRAQQIMRSSRRSR